MSGDLAFEWARTLMHALVEAGVRFAVASPGSRSTPLVLAAAAEPRLCLDVIVDERSAAFFALGAARVSGRPTALVCTSGSAGAHYLPALLEAERALLPLIAITADRPWELEHLHANQTLEQRYLFGNHVRQSLELGEPDPARLEYVSRIAALAVQRATSPVPGPVHLNARFRKPLEPSGGGVERTPGAIPRLERATSTGLSVPASVNDVVARARRGLVVCGPRRGAALGDARLRQALGRFAGTRGFAVVAEVTSGVAHGPECPTLPAFDAWLPRAVAEGDGPDLVIEIGSPPTSSGWEKLASGLCGTPRIVVSEDGLPDPWAAATLIVEANPAQLFEALPSAGASDSRWLGRLAARAEQAAALLSEAVAGATLSEPAVAKRVFDAVPDGGAVFVGNSLPVRDADWFASRSSRALTVLHQRGLAGIDGLIAGVAGARRALPPETALFALIGDVSALHDVGSLAVLARVAGPVTLVVIDNGGGRIFSELPVASTVSASTLERLFSTPPPDFLAHAARAFGVGYERIETRAQLDRALDAADPAARVLQVVVPPGDGRARRRSLRDALTRAPAVSA